MRDVVALDAADSRMRQREPVGEHGRNSGYLSRCGNNSSTRYTVASRSERCSVTFGLTSNQVWGLTKTDQEWSEKLDTALTAARRNDLKHGTNAAYLHGRVCPECREHQRIRMGRNGGSFRRLGLFRHFYLSRPAGQHPNPSLTAE
jgi:hypothetical protein